MQHFLTHFIIFMNVSYYAFSGIGKDYKKTISAPKKRSFMQKFMMHFIIFMNVCSYTFSGTGKD